MSQTKTTDNKGRVTLGERFANRTVIVEEVDETEVRVTLARVIPEREAWLHENEQAMRAVEKGLAQAGAGEFGEGPDLKRARRIADSVPDKNE